MLVGGFIMRRSRRHNIRLSLAGFILANCLATLPAMSQEVLTWVDEEGTVHFGHAATSSKYAHVNKSKGISQAVHAQASASHVLASAITPSGEDAQASGIQRNSSEPGIEPNRTAMLAE